MERCVTKHLCATCVHIPFLVVTHAGCYKTSKQRQSHTGVNIRYMITIIPLSRLYLLGFTSRIRELTGIKYPTGWLIWSLQAYICRRICVVWRCTFNLFYLFVFFNLHPRMGLQERCLPRVRSVMHIVSDLSVTCIRKTGPFLRDIAYCGIMQHQKYNSTTRH
jgi:hypothetical protein